MRVTEKEELGLASDKGRENSAQPENCRSNAWPRFGGLKKRRTLASHQREVETKEEPGLASGEGGAWPRFGGRKSLASPRIQDKKNEPCQAAGKRRRSLPRLKERLALPRVQ
jgi:hypothetical protein